MFPSATSARLQEIGPRFTLKLRWLRKGLPAVTAGDGQIPKGGDPEDIDEKELSPQGKKDETEAMGEIASQSEVPLRHNVPIPALDEEQEYEWKWKVGRWKHQRYGTIVIAFIAQDGGLQADILFMILL